MGMIRAVEFLSLDGVIHAPGAPEEDTEGGFRHGGWQRAYFEDVLGATAAEGMAQTDAYLPEGQAWVGHTETAGAQTPGGGLAR